MPLAPVSSSRKPLHVRSIQVQAFERDDGLLDLEAHLTDVKPFDVPLTAGVRPAGQPVHVKDRMGATQARPFQIDCCHALASDGAAVAMYYPQWYRNKQEATR